jgi:hypothetical protein
MTKKIFSTVLAILMGTIGSAYAQGEHLRFSPGETPADGALEIAVTEFTSPSDPEIKVTLYGVVHIADMSYYQQVQKDLAKFDTVLYEGIKPDEKPNQSTVLLNTMQKLFGDVLGLTFQKDGINYVQENYVHADISISELREKMNGQPLTPLDGAISPETLERVKPLLDVGTKLVKILMDNKPELRNSIKMQFGSQLGNSDISKQLKPEMHKAIVLDRNQIVMDVLDRELEEKPTKKSIVIFYGAGHNADFVKRFKERGYTQTSKRWMTAWAVGAGAKDSEGPESQVEPR